MSSIVYRLSFIVYGILCHNVLARKARYTRPVNMGVILDARVHGPWTRVLFFDTRAHGPWTWASFWAPSLTVVARKRWSIAILSARRSKTVRLEDGRGTTTATDGH